MSNNDQIISDKDYKKTLVNILKFIDEVSRQNHIEYSLFAGSLIGAVRHNGIIPWDDDIDIILDINNYQKLISILKEQDSKYKLLNNDTEKTYYYPYAKLTDTTTEIEEIGCKKINNYGVYVDIFCYHNAPKSKLLKLIHYYKIQFYKIVFSGYAHEKIKISYKLAFFKLLGKIYAKHTGINNIIKRYNKLITKNDGNKELKEIISDWPVYGSKKEYQKKANINHYSDCSFEKNTARMFSNYDEILSTTFGDYMTPPPKDKRKSRHSISATWKASEEING